MGFLIPMIGISAIAMLVYYVYILMKGDEQ